MANLKSTKRALISSAIALLLCFSMLLGTTFAWFTDSVTSANNVIVAGNLNVELYYQVEGQSDWTKVTSSTNVFKATLWEPGHVEVVKLKVVNEGSLALKYQLGVNVASEKGSVNVKGESFKLSEFIKFGIVEGAQTYTRDQAVAAVDATATALNKAYNSETTNLLPLDDTNKDNEDIVTMVVYMPTTVGNEANYAAGEDAPSINLGINLFATQTAAEEDAFGNDYDEDTWENGIEVTNETELQAAINAGQNVVLSQSITLSNTLTIPATAAASTMSLRSAPVAQVIDLNGNTISGATGKALIENNGVLAIIGGTVENTALNGGATISNKGTLTLENINVVGAPIAKDDGWPSYCISNAGNLTVKAGTNVSADRGCLFLSGTGETVIEDGTFTNNDIHEKIGGRAFTSHVVVVGYGANKLTINGGTFQHFHTKTSGGVVINNWSAVTVDINGGSFSGGNYFGKWDNLSDYGYGSTKTPFAVKGGTFTGMDENYIAEGYTSVNNADGTIKVVKGDVVVENTDGLKEQLNAGKTEIALSAGTYTFPASSLNKDVTLECAEGTVFEGTSSLNVGGATVVGATFDNETGTSASGTINGTFKDCEFTGSNALRWCYAGETVVFENCVFSGDVYGVHFDGGANKVVFKNCTLSGFNAMGGAITELVMEGCTFKANETSGYNGINLWGSVEMTDCTFVFDGTKTEWVDLCGDNTTAVFTNCVVTDGENEKGMEYVVGNYGEGNTIIIDGVYLANDNAMLTAAVAAGASKVLLTDGEYDLNGNQKNGLTVVAIGNDVKVANTTKYASGKSTGAIWQKIHLENVTLTNTVYTMADGGNSTFKNVTFAAGVREAYGSGVVFTDCTFGSNSEGYALHFQTDSKSEGGVITLNGCEFEGGKVHLGGKRAYTFTGCDFAAGTDFQVWSNITLVGCTVDGVEVTAENISTLFPNLNLEKVTLQ